MPAGKTLDLSGLCDGAAVNLQGNVSFGVKYVYLGNIGRQSLILIIYANAEIGRGRC